MYLIKTDGKKGLTLFLVDRKKTKKYWWDTSTDNAMIFRKLYAAKIQANKLKYNNPEVITIHDAAEIEMNNMDKVALEDVHPFSSEGLGQD